MSFKSQFTGVQIDEALSKIMNASIVENGWIKLISTNTEKTDLNKLLNPGNYTTNFYINGPLGLTSSPINISVYTMFSMTAQIISTGEQCISRLYNRSTSTFADWETMEMRGVVFASNTPPTSPVDGKSIWLDVSMNPPLIKVYINGSWVQMTPTTAMKKSVYDPNNIGTDFYEYIDTQIAASDVGTGAIDFNAHISDTTIHLSDGDRNRIANSVQPSYIDNKVTALEANLQDDIKTEVSTNLDQINQVASEVTQFTGAVNTHIADTAKHPTPEKQLDWDSKAAGDHTHNKDGKVIVAADNIEGTIPIEKLPYDVKERTYVVQDETALLALTLNPVHNGDSIIIDNGVTQRWFFVIDQTKLGTMAAFMEIKTSASTNWADVINKPTTVEGYGITDSVSSATVTELQTLANQLDLKLPDPANIAVIQDMLIKMNTLQAKVESFNKVYAGLDGIITRVDELCKL